MVLTVVFPTAEVGQQEPLRVDIVAVHGLGGDAVKSWTDPGSGACWIRDFLPLDVTGARVMTFGYNADAAFGNTTADILDHAKDLLGSLIDKREEADELQRPVIFIAHSLGGIVVKQALAWAATEAQYQDIKERTIGVIFFGTPHRGSEMASYGKVLTNVVAGVMRKPSSKLINALQTNSETLMRLTREFRPQLPNYKVISFYEMRPMNGTSSLVVEKHSALLDVEGEDQIPVDANHREICKFRSRSNSVYDKLYRRVRRLLVAPEYTQNSSNISLNIHYLVPHSVSAIFTGREGTLKELEQVCPVKMPDASKIQKRFVVYGLGGSGKTQVCLKFAQDYRERFWGIFWVDASGRETAEQGFLDIARACGLEEDFERTKMWLSNIRQPWLLIIDNADDPSMDVSRYFPTGNRGAVLVATRNPECSIHATVGSSEFGEMEAEEAVTLLLKAAAISDVSDQPSRDLAKPLVGILGCLALAIAHAGAVIRRKLYTMKEYRDAYSLCRRQLLSGRPTQMQTDYKYAVYTTWEVSVDMIRKMPSEAASNAIEILHIFSFLHFENISEEIFERAWDNSEGWRRAGYAQPRFRLLEHAGLRKWDPHPIREAVGLLSSFSLIIIDKVKGYISMHPLVHAWARDRLPDEEQAKSWMAAALILAISISWEFKTSDYQFRRLVIPHIDSCLRRNKDKVPPVYEEGRFQMLPKFALAYSENGRLQEAGELRENVLEATKRILGEEHPDTLLAMRCLSNSYDDLGRMQEAMKLREELLEAEKKILGEEHLSTLHSMHCLAISYYDLGRMREAINLEEKVLESRKRVLGDEHLDTLHSMNNLAVSYSGMGRIREAVNLREKVLEARKRILGDEHPDTLLSISNLSSSYSELGRIRETVELDEKVLEAGKRTLGEEHPDTLHSMNYLSTSYYHLGRIQEAMELSEKVLEVRKRILGEEHPDTLQTMCSLANSYSELGRMKEALEIQENVLEVRKRILGEEHPDTLYAMHSLATSYDDLGWMQEAAELHGKVLEARKRILGDEHPDTLHSMNNLSSNYCSLGRIQQAVELREKTLEIRKKILGGEHPDTLHSMDNLSASYSDLGWIKEAVELTEKTLEARKKVLGEEHPETLNSMNSLAGSYYALDRNPEAIKLQEKIVETSQRVLGNDHPQTRLYAEDLKLYQTPVHLPTKLRKKLRSFLKNSHCSTRVEKLLQRRPTGGSLAQITHLPS